MSSMQPLAEPDPNRIEIRVEVHNDKVRVEPESVRIAVGGTVLWYFDVRDSHRVARAEIYFDEGSPFLELKRGVPASIDTFRTVRRRDGGIEPVERRPSVPGDYKYGVRIVSKDDEELDDDDPWLHVE
jgi:plastocyanin